MTTETLEQRAVDPRYLKEATSGVLVNPDELRMATQLAEANLDREAQDVEPEKRSKVRDEQETARSVVESLNRQSRGLEPANRRMDAILEAQK